MSPGARARRGRTRCRGPCSSRTPAVTARPAASRRGSPPRAPRGIAERIAARLAERTRVELHPVESVDDLARYDAVVFGSPVYDQVWPPEADSFVRERLTAL